MKRARRLAAVVAGVTALASVAACGSGNGNGDKGGSAADVGPLDPNTKVSITVGCQPPKSSKALRKEWDNDVAAFEKLHPNITIVSKDAFPCEDPKTFTAKLAGGQMENVYYVYLTDAKNIIENGQAADITKYVSGVKNYQYLQPQLLNVFKGGGRLWGLPKTNYSMGLLYNRKLFQQAGLNPDQPPTTWDEVRADAKKIAALGNGIVGYADYSANNQGGWHFTAEMYSQGGDIVTPDGKKAAFNSPQGHAVLQNLQQMRWTDNSMGSKQLLQIADVQPMMASGKLGMYLSAPDNIPTIKDQFQGKFEDYGLAPMPAAQGTLIGGDGYMFNRKDTPDQIKAGILWLEFENLTPGKGQFDWAQKNADKQPVGLPQPNIFTGPPAAEELSVRTQNANLPVQNYKAFADGDPKVKYRLEPPQAQQIYAVLDGVVSSVLTNRNADINSLLSKAETKVNGILANAD
ncbi:ABC transporter substrate-binding protein [Actinoallomurus iriomotensis]|uniref:Sugar ABC transporter substrate-binding protein n=1 Tax=Actinoallomurus iriomotensis TaxID=478107 RepID=A0A9W6W426_9ACTN|nr:extracellular solute-binding protein [Actinoallomurus iriomotensis]GLY90575.1 sugar ABC transporter substrate-binding protein [Actinoallomurus iriomotensis]